MQLHKLWWRAAAVRALKTMAQTAVAMLPAAATITAVDFKTVFGASPSAFFNRTDKD